MLAAVAPPERPLAGKTCLITGASGGIGLVTARELAVRGASVIILGRSAEGCYAAVNAIRAAAPGASAEVVLADLSSMTSVRQAAHALRDTPRIDVLVNNAGGLFAHRRESEDGFELTLATNHLGPFLLTNLLLPRVLAAAPARIINVSSDAHSDVKAFDFNDPHAKRRVYPSVEIGSLFFSLAMPWAHPGFMQYAMTKLANLLFTTELARRLEGRGVTVNALHPGLVATSISRANGSFGWFMRRFIGLRGIGVEEGAKTTIYLAASPEVAGITGTYFVKEKPAPMSKPAQDRAAAERLWKWSEEATGLTTVR